MFVVFWALNNITAQRLFITCRRVPSDSYHYQTTNKKLLDQKGIENTSMITTPILLLSTYTWGRLGF